jgi:hypothetical protein
MTSIATPAVMRINMEIIFARNVETNENPKGKTECELDIH